MKITENPERNVVVIDDIEVPGYIDEAKCEACGVERIYYEKYDAYFCAQCNRWLESLCPDSACPSCRSRPGSPLPAAVV